MSLMVNAETEAANVLNGAGKVLNTAAVDIAGASDAVNSMAGNPAVSMVSSLVPHGPEIVAVIRTSAATLSAIANLFEKLLASL